MRHDKVADQMDDATLAPLSVLINMQIRRPLPKFHFLAIVHLRCEINGRNGVYTQVFRVSGSDPAIAKMIK